MKTGVSLKYFENDCDFISDHFNYSGEVILFKILLKFAKKTSAIVSVFFDNSGWQIKILVSCGSF